MGKKKRVLLNPKKFGKKHFEFLDNLDGVNDNIISSTKVPLTIRTLNLVDNGDRTVKLTAEIYGSGSGINELGYQFWVTGGADSTRAIQDRTGAEQIAFGSSGSTGFTYASSLPALKDYSGNVMVLPEGRVEILAFLATQANDPGTKTDPKGSATAFLVESINVGRAPIGLTSAQLAAALSGALDGSTALAINMDQMSGTGPQHGSGSGVGSTDSYGPDSSAGSKHGYSITVSGSVSGSTIVSATATANNGHSNNGEVEIVNQTNMNASGSQVITITFTPRDVNNALSTGEAVSTTLTLS